LIFVFVMYYNISSMAGTVESYTSYVISEVCEDEKLEFDLCKIPIWDCR